MRRLPVGLLLLSLVGVLTCGCPQFTPPIEPNVSLFPTVFPVDILDQCTPVDLPVSSLRDVFVHAGWQSSFGSGGVSETNLRLLARGLRNRGYAELDARRARGPIRWVAFQVMKDGETLIATAGYDSRPPAAHMAGATLRAKPAESTRRDAYNYPLAVETWQGRRTNVPMVVEQVVPLVSGRQGHWEIRHFFSLRDPEH